MTTKQTRQTMMRLDRQLARAATPGIAKVIAAERRRVRAATATVDTPAAWEKAARAAVSTDAWVKAIIQLWTNPRLRRVWDAQQDVLGTDLAPKARDRTELVAVATSHGREIADTRRDHYSTLVRQNTTD